MNSTRSSRSSASSVGLRLLHLADEPGPLPHLGGRVDHLGAGAAVGVVGDAGAGAGAGLHQHLDAARFELALTPSGVSATRRSSALTSVGTPTISMG